MVEEKDMEARIQEALEYEDDEEGINYGVKRICSFAAAGVLTSSKGLVVKMKDGSEFQLTIVKSK